MNLDKFEKIINESFDNKEKINAIQINQLLMLLRNY